MYSCVYVYTYTYIYIYIPYISYLNIPINILCGFIDSTILTIGADTYAYYTLYIYIYVHEQLYIHIYMNKYIYIYLIKLPR